jgi:thiol-disulfide isomerase/thioredoxin
MKSVFAFVFLLCSALVMYAQENCVLKGRFETPASITNVLLQSYDIENAYSQKDTVVNNTFKLVVPKTIKSGLYRLSYSDKEQTKYTNLLIDGKETEIVFNLNVTHNTPEFTTSEQNKKWVTYLAQSDLQLKKAMALSEFIKAYPDKKDNIVKSNEKEFYKQKNLFLKDFERFCAENKNTLAGLLVENSPVHFANPLDTAEEEEKYIDIHYWDGVNPALPELINTPIYTRLIANYLNVNDTGNNELSENDKNKKLMERSDFVMNKFSENPETKQFALKLLTLIAKKSGKEVVLQYLDEKYAVNNQCDSDLQSMELKKRMEGYALLKPGNVAPDFSFIDEKGTKQRLSAIAANQLLIVFWASWCAHCQDDMPKLEQYLQQNKNIKVVAVSLDEDILAYNKSIDFLPHMIHTCDLQKWDGATARLYHIAATPTFILLDKDKKIINKYPNFKAFESEVNTPGSKI